jgi:Tfp pilus assembly protein PilO
VKSDLKDQMRLLTRAQWWMALGLLALIALVGLLLIHPASARLAAIGERIELQRRELQTAETRLAGLPSVELQTEQLRQRVEYFDRQMPRHRDLPQLIGDVTKISRSVSLGKLAWRPEATQRRTEQFTELPLDFTFQGNFLNVFSFLSHVEDMPRLTRLQKLDLQAKDGTDGQVDVQLTMNIYFSEE